MATHASMEDSPIGYHLMHKAHDLMKPFMTNKENK